MRSMDTPRKKIRFDPYYQREQFQARRRAEKELLSCCNALKECVKRGFSVCGAKLLENLSREDMNLALVALLGLKGVRALLGALAIVPEMPAEDHIRYITNVVSYCRGKSKPLNLNDADIQALIPLVDRQESDDIQSILQQVSQDKGVAHTAFLVPPVCQCINAECKDFQSGKFLSKHHKPITVTLFTVNGPVPATKILYRCRECNTNYNYAMYGQKFFQGERFYSTQRPYIEITDEVYCERNLFRLYSLLRYLSILTVATSLT